MADADARAELAQHQDRLLELPGVIGTGIGLDDSRREVIHVYVQAGTPPDDVRTAAQRVLAGTPFQVIQARMPEAE